MPASRNRAVVTAIVSLAALLVAAVLVWAATAGPVGVVGETDRSTRISTPPASDEAPERAPEEDSDSSSPERSDDVIQPPEVDWLVDLLTFVLLLGILWLAALALKRVVSRLARDVPDPVPALDLEVRPDVDVAREALARDPERHSAALAGGDVRNGIVACWVMLEEDAAGAGYPHLASETPTEFVVHVLHELRVDPAAVAELAGLFHEARFSSHELSTDARSRAERALAKIHADLSSGLVRR